jgi:hypothetical protein
MNKNNNHTKVVRIKGGLGNQLFQYSFSLFLSKILSVNIDLDISWFDNQNLRKFQLDQVINNLSFNIKNKTNNSIFEKLVNYRLESFHNFCFKKKIYLPLRYFDGYWQDIFYAKYLNSIQYFNKKIFSKKYNHSYYVVHIRRGDFINSKSHTILFDEHYLKYINIFNDKKIYVLSNNKKDTLNIINKAKVEIEFVECNDLEAFGIIYNASGGIASNSTFCWWPIYLSECRNWLVPFQWLKKKNIIEHNLQIKNTILI